MRHRLQDADSQMEIDHFDPTLEGAARNRYSNLMLATAHCNNFKRKCRALRKTGKDVGAKPDRGSEGVMGEDGGPCEGRR